MKKLLVILLVLGLAAPAMAADWNFFGSARMTTFYTDTDGGDNDLNDDQGTFHFLQGNSRIGANVKVNDQIGGAFEYGTGVNVRKLYGTYNFGAGNVLVGQTYTPTSNYFYSNSVYLEDGDLLGLGQFYAGRRAMVQLTLGGFKFALVNPAAGITTMGTYTDTDYYLPKFELSYSLKTDVFFVDVYGGYLTYQMEDRAADETIDMNAYVVGAGGGVTFGPVTVAMGGSFGQNWNAYGAGGTASALDGDEVVDVDSWQAHGVVNFKVNDALSFEVGAGYYVDVENEDVAALANDDNDKAQYYANAVVTITKGFFLVPEVGVIDYMEYDDVDEGQATYVGLKWQINF